MIPLTKTLTFNAPLGRETIYSNELIHEDIEHTLVFTLTDPEEAYIQWEVDGEIVAEIGLWFNGKVLVDYDGVFELPEQLITWLNEMGYNTEEIWESF